MPKPRNKASLKRNTGSKRLLDPATLERAADEIAELALEADIDVALTGGFALQLYGSPRLTGDVDFIAEALIPGLPELRRLTFGGIETESPSGVPTDLIVRNDDAERLYDAALTHATSEPDLGYKVVRPEYLAAMKLYAGRRRDLDDLAFLITSGELDVKEARDIIKKYLGVYAAKEFAAFVAETEWKKERG